MSGDSGDDFETRRAQGKRTADMLRDRFAKKGDELGWFEACYEAAEGDAAKVPWGHLNARPELIEWLAYLPDDQRSGRALDVGCGLGDNAAALARAGFEVTAFDISPTAIDWAKARFSSEDINWLAADLLDPPVELSTSFDLVNETYTLQALRGDHRRRALSSLAGFVKPGGRLIIVCRGLRENETPDPPPWPLKLSELDYLLDACMEIEQVDELNVERYGRTILHFRAQYRKNLI